MPQSSHGQRYCSPYSSIFPFLVRLGVVFLTTLTISATSSVPLRARAQSDRPNVVLFITDDQPIDTLEYMPTVQRELASKGVTFSNAYVTTPHCCPSRSSILTGQYAHNHGVLRNGGEHGGWRAFDPSSTLATWLQTSGMRTMLAGKYLNLYRSDAVPPGWSEWFAIWDTGAKYRNFTVNHNAEIRFFEDREAQYSTRVLRDQALAWLRDDPERPFFLYLAFDGPHAPAEPARRDRNLFEDYVHHVASFNEYDVSDKPSWVQSLPPLGPDDERGLDNFRRRQLLTLQAIDRAVGMIVDQLRADGRLAHTWLFFLSDNGMSLGEHRYGPHKSCGYEECVRVPYIVTPPAAEYPTIERGTADRRLVLNIDLAPTIADISGVSAPAWVDGQSLVPILQDTSAPGRAAAGLELWSNTPATSFQGIRTSDWKYLRYENGEDELYNLATDPNELENLAGRPEYTDLIRDLSAEVDALMAPRRP